MIKIFLKDSLLYTVANLFTKGITFLMLPLYLTYLSKAEYGIFDYLVTVQMFLGVIVSLEISQAVLRFTSGYKDDKKKQAEVISCGIQLTLFSYFVLLILVFFASNRLSYHFFGEYDKGMWVIQVFLAYAVMALMYLVIIIYRAQLNAKAATLSSTISAALTALFTFLLLEFYSSEMMSLVWGMILGQGLVVGYNLIRIRYYWFCRIEWDRLKEMLAFSAPLVLSSIGVISATLIDRVMIKQILGYDDLGVYSIAAKYAAAITLLVVGFQSALAPLVYSNLNNPTIKQKLRFLFFGYTFGSFIFIVFLFIVSKPMMMLLFGEGYTASAELMPIITVSIAFQHGYLFFPGLSIVKKTAVLAKINLFTGAVNIGLNFFLIEWLGLWGAVWATVISGIVFFFLNVYFSEKYFPIFYHKLTDK